MRILVTGASGLLGGRVAELLAEDHTVVAARHRTAPPGRLESIPLDLRDAASMRAAIDLGRPDAIVHAGALADADACEREPGLAARLNTDAPRELARLSRMLGLRFVSFSTDLVLDGQSAWSDEAVEARPLLVYGRAKLDGEHAILEELPDAVVFRVALVHGCGFGARSTASETVAWALIRGASPRLFVDQYRTSIDPESVASAIAAALAGRGRGLFHLGGPERLSRLELGLRTARALGLDERRLVRLRQAEIPLPVPRPLDASMDSRRASRELGWSARPVDQALAESRLASPNCSSGFVARGVRR